MVTKHKYMEAYLKGVENGVKECQIEIKQAYSKGRTESEEEITRLRAALEDITQHNQGCHGCQNGIEKDSCDIMVDIAKEALDVQHIPNG